MYAYPDDPLILDHIELFIRGMAPKRAQLGAALRTAFAASLESEEGRLVQFSLYFLFPGEWPGGLDGSTFAEPIPLAAERLARLAPALLPSRSHFCVSSSATGDLQIVGCIYLAPWTYPGGLLIQAMGPGILVVRHASDVILTYRRGRFVCYKRGPANSGRAAAATWGLFARPPAGHDDLERVVRMTSCRSGLAEEMLKIGHGGTLLIVPNGAAWRSHATSVRGELAKPYCAPMRAEEAYYQNEYWNNRLACELNRDAPRAGELSYPLVTEIAWLMKNWQYREELAAQLEAIARLTAIDGMVVLSATLEVLSFGVFFAMYDAPDFSALVFDPYEPEPVRLNAATALGGARHQSAAAAVLRVPGALAIVVSSDASLTTMSTNSTGLLEVHNHLELVLTPHILR